MIYDLLLEFKKQIKLGAFCIHPHVWLFSKAFDLRELEGDGRYLKLGKNEYPKNSKVRTVAHNSFVRQNSRLKSNDLGFYLCDELTAQKYSIAMQNIGINEKTLTHTFAALNSEFVSEYYSSPMSRIDLMSDSYIVEVKKIDMWKHALGQVLTYKVENPEHQCAIMLFGNELKRNRLKDIVKICSVYNVHVYFWSTDNKINSDLSGLIC